MGKLIALLRPRSLQGQLAAGVAALVAVLALVLALALGGVAARQARHAEAAALHTAADNAAQMLGQGLVQREREVRALAASPSLWREGLSAERVQQALQRSQAVNPHHVWIGVADAQGIVRSATGGMLVGVDVSQRPWFQAGLRAVHVGDVHPAELLANMLPPGSDGGPQRCVDFAAPIVIDGKVAGVVAIHGSWDWTRDTIESLLPTDAADRGLEIIVFDRKREPIYAAGKTLDAHRAARQMLPLTPGAGAQASRVRWADGDEYLSSAAALAGPRGDNDLGWTIVAREPLAVAWAAAERAAALALGLGLVAALFASGLGAWVASLLTAPLAHIAKAAPAVGQGHERMPIVTSSAEVESLSGALAAMTDRLLQAKTELEQRVAERTAELQRANAELALLARHDPLTGLLNRRGLDERLRELVAAAHRRAAPVAVLLVDADHFKRINDRFGHDVGDDVLRALAAALRSRLREQDLLARIGGEEFVAVLPDTDAQAAARVAAALVALVAARPVAGAGTVTVSIGVAQLDAAHEAPADALRRADQAVYRAKAAGRNRFDCDAGRALAAA